MTARLAPHTAAAALACFAAACTSAPLGIVSDFSDSDPAPVLAPMAQPAQQPGYALTGQTFSGELVFDERAGRVVVLYRHGVDGAPGLVAELDLEDPWLADGVRRFEGVSDQGVTLEVALVSGPCQVNGEVHARFARVTAGRGVYEGCARETGPVLSWTEALPDLLPALAACEADARTSSMAFVPRTDARIVHGRLQEGVGVLRYRFDETGRWDCEYESGRVRWSIVPQSQVPLLGEGQPVLAPGRMPEAGDGCYLYERVQTPDGTLIGALGEDVCSSGFADAVIALSFG